MWRRLFARLFATTDEKHLTVLRVVLGAVMFAHGAQKVLGWWGGMGPSQTIEGMASHMGIPPFLTVGVMIAEFFGGLALIAGLLNRVAAFGIFTVMVGAAVLAHVPNGFFMNWTRQKGGEGIEYHLIAGASAVALMMAGAGAFSLDRLISRRLGGQPAARARVVPVRGHDQPVVPAH